MDQTQFCLVLFLLAVFRDMWNFFYTTEAIVFHNVDPWHRHFLSYFPVDHIFPRSYLKLLPRQNTWEVIHEMRKVNSAQNDVLVLSKPRQISGDQCDKVCTDADTRHIVRVGWNGRGGGWLWPHQPWLIRLRGRIRESFLKSSPWRGILSHIVQITHFNRFNLLDCVLIYFRKLSKRGRSLSIHLERKLSTLVFAGINHCYTSEGVCPHPQEIA